MTETAERYLRQVVLPGVGENGQERLAAGRIAIVGVGGLGCPVLQYCAAAGVGRFKLIDGDVVELSNLNRQTLYREEHLGKPKAEQAARWLAAFNGAAESQVMRDRLTAANIDAALSDVDLILDCTDNIETRYLISDWCAVERRAFIHASVQAKAALIALFDPADHICLRCFFPEPAWDLAPTCAENGVLGVWPGFAGVLQAETAIRVLLGDAPPIEKRVLYADLDDRRMVPLRTGKAPLNRCSLCEARQEKGLQAARQLWKQRLAEEHVEEIDPESLLSELSGGRRLQFVDVRSAQERAEGAIRPSHHLPIAGRDRAAFREALAALVDPADEVVFICASGTRSRRAVFWTHGHGRRRSLAGGLAAWRNAGLSLQLSQNGRDVSSERGMHETCAS